MMIHSVPISSLPTLSRAQMIEVDRLMIERYGIDLLQMMENAGRELANLVRVSLLAQPITGSRVVILAGKGGNGGGALVAARRLYGFGAKVEVLLAGYRERFSGAVAHQLTSLEMIGVPINRLGRDNPLGEADIVVDGLIGYSLMGAPRGEIADLIRLANESGRKIIALDLPSGLDADTGEALEPTIRALATLTLALPKQGLLQPGAGAYTGDLYLADIGVPPGLYREESIGLTVGAIFAEGTLLQLATDRA